MQTISDWQIKAAFYNGVSFRYYATRNETDPLYITTYPGIAVTLRTVHVYLPFTKSIEKMLFVGTLEIMGDEPYRFTLNTTNLALQTHEIPSIKPSDGTVSVRSPFIVGGRLYLEMGTISSKFKLL